MASTVVGGWRWASRVNTSRFTSRSSATASTTSAHSGRSCRSVVTCSRSAAASAWSLDIRPRRGPLAQPGDDGVPSRSGPGGVDVDEVRVVAGHRGHLGDARAHRPRADHRDRARSTSSTSIAPSCRTPSAWGQSQSLRLKVT